MPAPPYAWMGNVRAFLDTPAEELMRRLTAFARETGAPQLYAWDRTLTVLHDQLRALAPQADRLAIVLEFELPLSGGERPDLIVLENGTVLVIEFKNRVDPEDGDFQQVLGYVRDLSNYHAECDQRQLIPILIPIGMTGSAYDRDGVHVLPPTALGAFIKTLAAKNKASKPDPERWVRARYQPLPGLVAAARLLFARQPLPLIKAAESARIPEVVDRVTSALRTAMAQGTRLLVFVSGVPGSGKTLVGLQTAHAADLGGEALFLSGNGPLVQVLKHALNSDVFVRDIHAYFREHLVRTQDPPIHRVLIFDEAQRAWDRDRVILKHQGSLTDSEPGLLLRIADRKQGAFGVLALIGDGQEIHAGEESGMTPWVDALATGGRWQVLGPPEKIAPFKAKGIPCTAEPLLNLTLSLRSHRAEEVAAWSNLLLAGKLDDARAKAATFERIFPLRISRSLETCRAFIRDRYSGKTSKRYGLITSSKFRKLDALGIRQTITPFYYYGEWYHSSPEEPRSSCQLKLAVSEFGCQGLELDMPLLVWGPDLAWTPEGWMAHVRKSKQVHDPGRLRLNAYRVLLTRGRDGLVACVPSEPKDRMNTTYDALIRSGFKQL